MGRAKAPDMGFDQFERFLDEWSRRDVLKGIGGAVAFSAFLAGGVEFLAACANAGTQKSNTANAVKGGHLVEGTISDIANVNPIYLNDTASQVISGRCYDGLLDIDAAGNLIPAIAKTVPKPDADNVTYKFDLRQDAKWSDGTPVTSDDAAFTFQSMYDPKWKAAKSRFRPDFETYMKSAVATDKYTVVVTMNKIWASFMDNYGTIGMLPAHIWSKMDPAAINSTDLNTLPTVVNGAFIPVKWDKGQQYTMKRNDTYWRGAPYLDTFVYKVVTDAVAIANQLKTGELDVGSPDSSQWDSLATVSTLNRLSIDTPNFEYYQTQLDPTKSKAATIFSDVKVRQALLYALNRPQVADRVYFKQAKVADSSIGSTNWVHVTPKAQYPFDVAKANSLLDAAGWAKGADGIRSKNGQRMAWELRTNAGNKVRENFIQVMADSWKTVGAEVTPKPVQFQQLVTQLTSTLAFDMILIGISVGNTDPDQSQLWHSRSVGQGLNGMGYKNPAVDKLLDDGLATLDRAKRKTIYAQVQEILMNDLPAPLVLYPKSLWALSKRVSNFNLGTYNRYGARPWFKDVFVTDGK